MGSVAIKIAWISKMSEFDPIRGWGGGGEDAAFLKKMSEIQKWLKCPMGGSTLIGILSHLFAFSW